MTSKLCLKYASVLSNGCDISSFLDNVAMVGQNRVFPKIDENKGLWREVPQEES